MDQLKLRYMVESYRGRYPDKIPAAEALCQYNVEQLKNVLNECQSVAQNDDQLDFQQRLQHAYPALNEQQIATMMDQPGQTAIQLLQDNLEKMN